MSSWNDSINFCNWVGVSCCPSNGSELTCETTALVGELPEERGGRLFPLQHMIILTFNYLGVLGLAVNKFIGEIPDQLSSLTKLVILGFGGNSFTGSLPLSVSWQNKVG
ncbi:hypothetical protein NC652_016236 [Populus alba x Populus x berolinensis]|uniref:Leucine-rich repeat-containing N-terminal plant-type domain-containing protein n=1 Tax=Populus alba x Populus x berolinensis TaxID=444605 RepID=A0AAD6QM76_9ROSI|nr:hypothetical protein NC652_016236 [Populus alba x Populus x berolinensis]KAJ6993011.1 hypothetical protein NC653_016210 [Populus alba x Populus x berolinensis]